MEIICPPEKCTGCYACANVCPVSCIAMQKDDLGAIHPVIDQNRCIDCKLCQKTCPTNRHFVFNQPLECFAAWRTNDNKRKFSASGGIGALMAEYVISKGGIVFGTKYNDRLIPVTTEARTLEEIEYFKGSKYVLSVVGNAFKEIKRALQENRLVLYIATPCQIAGLKGFLKKDYDNLMAIDLICHGVCPTSYFEDEINYIKKIHNIPTVTNVSFRGNGKDQGKYLYFHLNLFNKNKIVYNKVANWEYYFSGFLKGITLRNNCYICPYARPERISDITIGDFIGLGIDIPFPGPAHNNTAVIVNNEKGSSFLMNIQAAHLTELNLVKRDYAEAVKYGPSLKAPFPKHPLTDRFQKLYIQMGFVKAIRSVLRASVLKLKIEKILIKAPLKAFRIVTDKLMRWH